MAWTASTQCERALQNMNLILADTRRHVAALDSTISRADIERSRALALGAMVSVAEDFCQAVLDHLVLAGVSTNLTGRWLWDEVATRAFMSWEAHLALWSQWGVDVPKATAYKEFKGLIDARNSAVHGLGELTRVQQRKPGVVDRIRSGGLTVAGTRVVIDDSALETCRQRSSDFIRFMDHEFQRAIPT